MFIIDSFSKARFEKILRDLDIPVRLITSNTSRIAQCYVNGVYELTPGERMTILTAYPYIQLECAIFRNGMRPIF